MRGEGGEGRAREHYPAPYALIDLWETHGGNKAGDAGGRAGLVRQADGDADGAEPDPRVLPARADEEARGSGNSTIKHVHVIGAGAMGGDIAAWCAGQGLRVTLADMKAGADRRRDEARGRATTARSSASAPRCATRSIGLSPTWTGEGVRNADLIIEAVPEKLELKQKVYAGLEPKMKPGAILATNTSSIPLQDLRTTLARAERLRRPALLQSGVAAATGRGGQP